VPFRLFTEYIYIYILHTATHCNTHVCKPTHFYTIMDYEDSAFVWSIHIYIYILHTATHYNTLQYTCMQTHPLLILLTMHYEDSAFLLSIYIYIYCTLQHTATHLQYTCNTHVCKPTHFYTIMDYKQSAFSRNINMYMSFAPCTTLQHTATYMHLPTHPRTHTRTRSITHAHLHRCKHSYLTHTHKCIHTHPRVDIPCVTLLHYVPEMAHLYV